MRLFIQNIKKSHLSGLFLKGLDRPPIIKVEVEAQGP